MAAFQLNVNLASPLSKLALVYVINKRFKYNEWQAFVAFGATTWLSVHRILFDKIKYNIGGNRRYVATLVGHVRQIKNARTCDGGKDLEIEDGPKDTPWNSILEQQGDVEPIPKSMAGLPIFHRRRLHPHSSPFWFVIKGGIRALKIQKTSLTLFLGLRFLFLVIKRKGKVSATMVLNLLRDFSRTVLFVFLMPVFFWSQFKMHTALLGASSVKRHHINQYIAQGACLALLFENKDRWGSLANFMLTACL